MIVTLTPNTALDHTLIVESFGPQEKNRTFRSWQSALSMAAKPADAAYVLGALGIPSLALGFAAGDVGKLVQRKLAARGVRVAFTPVEGESRLNTVIIDRRDGSATTITTDTLIVSAAQVSELTAALTDALQHAQVLVIGGTMPAGLAPSLYASWIAQARAAGVPVIFDASEPYLSAGLAGGPTYIKPNRSELAALTGLPTASIEEALQAARAVQTRYNVSVIATLDTDGALALLLEHSYRIPPLTVPLISAAGAGDAVLAGIAASIARNEPIEQGLRLGIAAAAAVCMRLGTAECRREDVEALLPHVRLEDIAL